MSRIFGDGVGLATEPSRSSCESDAKQLPQEHPSVNGFGLPSCLLCCSVVVFVGPLQIINASSASLVDMHGGLLSAVWLAEVRRHEERCLDKGG